MATSSTRPSSRTTRPQGYFRRTWSRSLRLPEGAARKRRYHSGVGAILPKGASEALESIERVRCSVRTLIVGLSNDLSDLGDLTPKDRAACRAIVDGLEPEVSHAIEVAHAAVADWTRMRIDEALRF